MQINGWILEAQHLTVLHDADDPKYWQGNLTFIAKPLPYGSCRIVSPLQFRQHCSLPDATYTITLPNDVSTVIPALDMSDPSCIIIQAHFV